MTNERDNEVRTLLDRPKKGRPRKEDIPPPEASKATMEALAIDAGKAVLAESGYSGDPEYRHLLLVRLVAQGINPSKAATLAGFESKAQGMKVMKKARKDERFKAKLEDIVIPRAILTHL